MPKKPSKPPKPVKKPSRRQPNQWGGNGYRIAFARRRLAGGETYGAVRTAIIEHFRVHKVTAERDIGEAKRRNEELTNKLVPELIARNAQRLDVLADLATEDGKYSDAVQALREFHRIHGMHAPKKLQVTTTSVSVSLDIQAVVGVLDDDGLHALEVVLAQIEAARARGELALPAAATDLGDGEADDDADRN